ncbi:arabinosyltransferase domain-containing protein [Corynebacterium sp. ES2794-CONJ1]|nr:arabinosyltransferase domain-containing protein [Corynebacterium sp. ES2730-CONJ]MCU9519685.1 arabinosyltransferase domain-containing protein [Corynebacterium sp. ES2794-CONJ1]
MNSSSLATDTRPPIHEDMAPGSLTLGQAPGWLKKLAALSGVLGFFFFILTPFMPVNQVQSSFEWPQNRSLNQISAPLVSYAPQRLDATIPLQALEQLRDDETLVFSTLPPSSEQSATRGLFVRSIEGNIEVSSLGTILLQVPAAEVAELPKDATLQISTTEELSTAEIPGTDLSGQSEDEKDLRPQVSGIYTELTGDADALIDAGLMARVEINSRYTSSPTVLKYSTMILGAIFLGIALFSLYRLDRLDRLGRHRYWPKNFLKPRVLDGLVGAVLGYWYVFGANTSDDGFILTMARAKDGAGYMANYYRWFGVPESPFGAPYYDFLTLLSQVSTASMWMRLPSLIAGISIWLILSREILPRLGPALKTRRAAQWTAALMFLSFWLPYNNGLRPEPIIALGTLVTWVLFERSIAHQRLFPAAVGTIVAAFTLACGPTGLMAVSVLLVSLPQLLRTMSIRLSSLGTRRRHGLSWIVFLGPFFAAGTAVLVAVFGDQTLATVLESIHVRGEIGPSLKWFQEWQRYEVLFQQTVDGSFARRFAVLFAFIAVGLVFASILRHGKVPGSAQGPSLRLVLVFIGTLFFMSFTPTKWSHHFGVWAGIAPALGALAAVALSDFSTRSKSARTLFVGGLLFVYAFSLSTTNGYWYVASYGVPWWDKSIQIKAIEASSVMLAIALVILLIGAIQAVRHQAGLDGEHGDDVAPQKKRLFTHIFTAPIAALCALTVLFSMASLAKGFVSQYPAYSIGLGNLRTLAGDRCALASDTLVETDTNESFLKPIGTTLGQSLESGPKFQGFEPNRIPYLGSRSTGFVSDAETLNTNQGLRPENEEGVNDSVIRLPFNLDYRTVPVLGSYSNFEQPYAEAITSWYQLPPQREDAPLLVVSAAGKIAYFDQDGVRKDGRRLLVEYGAENEQGELEKLGELYLNDAIMVPTNRWRNLRLPLDALPAEATVVRLHAIDDSPDYRQWIAFTPPRIPTLAPLDQVIGHDQPGMIDWAVGFQFPCQRPFNHYAGVAEIPGYRISADADGKMQGSNFMDYYGGGALGPAEAVNESYELPSYAKDDWKRDWGSVEIYQPRANSVGEIPTPAIIDQEIITRSGLWNPGHQAIENGSRGDS